MVVVSAGSLCAGSRELPVGVHRQYNVIEIGDAFDSCRIHVRQVAFANIFAPARQLQFGGESYVDMHWSPEQNELGQTVDLRTTQIHAAVLKAEQLWRAGDGQRAFEALITYRGELPPYGRQLFLEIATEMRLWSEIVCIVGEPTSATDLVRAIDALLGLKAWERAQQLLTSHGVNLGLSSSLINEMAGRIRARRELGHGQ